MKSAWVVVGAVAVGLAMPGAFLIVRGNDSSRKIADPCLTREWRQADGVGRVSEQIALSAFDGAACDLGVSREELVLALARPDNRREFADEYDLDDTRIARAARAGLERSVADAEAAGAISSSRAQLLRSLVAIVPLDLLLETLAEVG